MTEIEAMLLAFEEDHPTHTRGKEALIRERFAISPARYYQIRNRLMRTEDGIAKHPHVHATMQRAPQGVRAMFPPTQ